MSKTIRAIALTVIILLSACNLPTVSQGNSGNGDLPNASTQAAQTVEALLTSQAVQNTATLSPANNVTPTNTLIPLPTNTNIPPVTATQNCDAMKFIADVTVPDNTVMTPGQAFTKTWRIQNSGTCSWTPSYTNVFSSGNAMGGPTTQALAGNVNPGATVDISMNFTAPGTNGDYTAYYKLRNAAGVLFGQFYVQIKVNSGGEGGGPFAVTTVSYTVTGTCGDFHIKAHITTNGPGTVEYYWEFNGSDPDEGTYGSTLTFDSAGTKTTPVLDWTESAPGDSYAQVYIDSPNHQFIGKAITHCP